MNSLVLSFKDIDKTKLNLVGGKGANLGELCRIDEVNVPDGFCISATAEDLPTASFAGHQYSPYLLISIDY